MPVKTTRRGLIAGGLALTLPGQRAAAAISQLGKIDAGSPLSWFPSLPADRGDWPASILTYADIAGYWQAVGIEPPQSFDDQTIPLWIELSERIPLNDGIVFTYAQQPWEQIVGFHPWDIDQLTVASVLPDELRRYHGTFDPERIAVRLTDAGYSKRSADSFTVLDSPRDQLDISMDLDRFALGHFHHLAASESVVMASRSAEALDSALAVAASQDKSLAEAPALAEIAPMLAELTGFMLMNGGLLGTDIVNPGLLEDVPTIPPARFFLAGIRVRDDSSVVSLIADLGDPDAAERAAPIVAERIDTLESPVTARRFAEDMAEFEVDALPGTGLVRLTVPGDEFATRWQRYVVRADLLFLATEEA